LIPELKRLFCWLYNRNRGISVRRDSATITHFGKKLLGMFAVTPDSFFKLG
jgi:hypothetical protein